MTVAEANQRLIDICKVHCQTVQGGTFGSPTLEDMEFIGKLHSLIEDFGK